MTFKRGKKMFRKYDIEALYEEYIASKKHGDIFIQLQRHLRIFITFIKKFDPYLNIDKQMIALYKNHVLELKKSNGYYHTATWMVQNLQYINVFLKWLVLKNIISQNYLSNMHEKQVLKEFKDKVNRRRLIKLNHNKGFYQNESLLEMFTNHIKKYYCDRTFSHALRTLKTLDDYCNINNKLFINFSYDDLDKLVKEWMNISFNPSLIIANYTLYKMFYVLKSFYYWLYEEGYKRDLFLADYTESKIIKYISLTKEVWLKDRIQLKKRRYSVKDILKSYKNYLEKTYENYGDTKELYNNLKKFIRFIVSRSENLYTADEELIEKYKQYLFNYEYIPGRFYSAYYQSRLIRAVKRFYDWFFIKGYISTHCLKSFKVTTYQKSIEADCLNRRTKISKNLEVPECFQDIYNSACSYELTLGMVKATLAEHKRGWRFFFLFLDKIGIGDIKDVDESVLNDYMVYVNNQETVKGRKPSYNVKVRRLTAVKNIFNYLARFQFLNRDPSFCIKLPKHQRGLPTAGMNNKEVNKLFKENIANTPKKIRDNAIIETLYSTGVRSNELRNLKLDDIDYSSGLVRVNVPKGGINHQRVVPIGKKALVAIQRYLKEVRVFSDKENSEYLFLSKDGNKLSTVMILNIVKSWKTKAKIRKNVVTHSFRVSCATEMLKGNADIKFVQQQLGHVLIGTTERYLRLVPSDLKKIHSKTHPREKRRIIEEEK